MLRGVPFSTEWYHESDTKWRGVENLGYSSWLANEDIAFIYATQDPSLSCPLGGDLGLLKVNGENGEVIAYDSGVQSDGPVSNGVQSRDDA